MLGRKDGAVVGALASHVTSATLVRFWPGAKCGLAGLLLVFASIQGLFPDQDSPVFFPPQESTSPNSNSTRIDDSHENQLRLTCTPL